VVRLRRRLTTPAKINTPPAIVRYRDPLGPVVASERVITTASTEVETGGLFVMTRAGISETDGPVVGAVGAVVVGAVVVGAVVVLAVGVAPQVRSTTMTGPGESGELREAASSSTPGPGVYT
jgi:hypothetical protein